MTLVGTIEVPPNTGRIVSAQWDFDGKGDYPVAGNVELTDVSGNRATVRIKHAFDEPGTYFPALRVASQREPDQTEFARVQNLARVRVVVREEQERRADAGSGVVAAK